MIQYASWPELPLRAADKVVRHFKHLRNVIRTSDETLSHLHPGSRLNKPLRLTQSRAPESCRVASDSEQAAQPAAWMAVNGRCECIMDRSSCRESIPMPVTFLIKRTWLYHFHLSGMVIKQRWEALPDLCDIWVGSSAASEPPVWSTLLTCQWVAVYFVTFEVWNTHTLLLICHNFCY